MLEQGHLNLGLMFSATPLQTSHVEECPEIGPICKTNPGEPAQIHDQSIFSSEIRVSGEYPWVDRWAAAPYLPIRIVRNDITYRNLDGEAITLPYQNIHHRDETLVGLSDPWLIARHARPIRAWRLDAQAGLTLPLGRTEDNPYEAAERGESHEHFQFGTGTFNPVIGLGARYAFSSWSPGLWGLALIVPYENGKGYQAGNRYAGGANAMARLASWMFRVGVQAQAEQAEHWDGVAHAEDGNRGRVDLMADLGASANVGDGWSLSAGVKVPVWTKVVGAQLDYPAIFDVGLSGTFELGGGHHGHAHDEREHEARAVAPANFAGLDVADIAPDGEAVDLVPVPGKITVFDFWASWCVPCRELNRRLLDLMRRRPGRIALRKLRVETWETAAAQRYLGDAPSLPHVKVRVAAGREAFSRSGDPADLVNAIEELLDD